MKSILWIAIVLLIAVSSWPIARAQQSTPAKPGAPAMSFFVTSIGKGDGANLGGLAGADAHCQTLAAAAGRGGMSWHAYLSTQGPDAVSARDRIGRGPWFNAQGTQVAANVADLHGANNLLGKKTSLTEKGGVIPGLGDTPNQHDILTGSQPDGRAYTDGADHTCSNYASNRDGNGAAQVGHHDKPSGQGGNNDSWNSAHLTRGCSQANLQAIGGAGLLYCFALN
jgi:hypothetical protein